MRGQSAARSVATGALLGTWAMVLGAGQGAAWAADRIPVAVLWTGAGATSAEGHAAVEAVHKALLAAPGVRPLDGAEDRRILVDGGPASELDRLIARAAGAFAHLRLSEAARDYEAAEALLLSDVPVPIARARMGEVERGLLACYDQMGRASDASRAAERLLMAGEPGEEMAALMSRHHVSRAWEPASAPVEVSLQPEGAQLWRNLAPIAAAAPPVVVAGGDPAIDFLDAEAPGYRRGHAALTRGGAISLVLQKEDRLGVMVDAVRSSGAEPAAAQIAELGRRLGAGRVLVVAPDKGAGRLWARWLDVGKGSWGGEVVHASGDDAGKRLAESVGPIVASAQVAAAAQQPKPAPAKSRLGVWGKWYTWVAAGAVVALVAGLLIAERVGDDKVTVSASH